MGLTKTDFMRGMQCPRMLWLDRHKPRLKVIPPEIQSRLDAGNDFGDRAMGMFGPYEEMTVYRKGTRIPDKKAMVEKTVEHLRAGTPVICEAAFLYYNNYCAVDILRRAGQGYELYEVKNAREVHDVFLRDTAFQTYLVRRCGLRIPKISLVLQGPDEERPFQTVDVTREVLAYEPWVDAHLWELNRMQKSREEIETEPGEQCTHPYECWYYGYCHDTLRPPADAGTEPAEAAKETDD